MRRASIEIEEGPEPEVASDAIDAAASPLGGPRSVGRVLALLNFVARRAAGSTLTELSTELDTPKSSLLLLLRPLLAEGYLVRDRNRYLLGPHMYGLAARIQNIRQPLKLLRFFLEELAEQSQETVYVAVLDEQSKVATFVDTVASSKMVRFVMPAGFSRPLYASAAGLLLLAYQDESWQQEYLSEIVATAIVANSKAGRRALEEELAKIRNVGLAILLDESMEGHGAIAAPVFDPEGKIEAALMIAAPTLRLRKNLTAFEKLIGDIAQRASATN